MTEKRFCQKDEDNWEIFDRGKHFAYAHSGYQAKKIINELNELVDTNRELFKENNQLKLQIKELEKEVLDLRAEVGRLNSKKEIEKPHWLKYESSKGYTKKVNQDIRFKGDVDD